jgi:MarR family transcriptional regulator, transcriptional regulator for hemolysin
MDTRHRNFGFLLREVGRRCTLRFEVRAREISVTLAQAKALVRLEKNEGVNQARLAELTEMDAMSMVRILDRMEADGLLERRLDPADRRVRCLYLTAKARPILSEIWRVSDEMRAEAFTGVSKAERDLFMSVLQRMHDNIAQLSADPADSNASSPQ